MSEFTQPYTYKKVGKKPKTKFTKTIALKRTAKALVNKYQLNKKIKKVVNSLEESKCQSVRFFNSAMYVYSGGNAVNFEANNVYLLTPNVAPQLQIVQGYSSGTRVGNTIRPVKVHVSMVMYPSAYNATTNPVPTPLDIRIIIFKIKNPLIALATVMANDFWNTGASAVTIQGDLEDMVLEPNKEVLTVYKDFRVKLGASQNSTTGGDANRQYLSNNDYKYNQLIQFDVEPPVVPTKITFNDNTATAQCPATYMIIIPAEASGTTAYQTAGQSGFTMTTDIYMYYKDA